MRRRNLFIAVVVSILLISLFSQPVWASSSQRHRWEGVMIGLGAAMLGGAILHHRHHSKPAPGYIYLDPPPPECTYYDYEEFWIPPAYRREWKPGRYDRRGRWKPGRWKERMVRPGHWEERRICRSYR